MTFKLNQYKRNVVTNIMTETNESAVKYGNCRHLKEAMLKMIDYIS